MNARGTWLVAAILLLAVAAAGSTLVYHWSRARAAIGYFGAENAALIRSADQVFLLQQSDQAAERRDISHVADLEDLQKALVEDASYRTAAQANDCVSDWSTTLQFHQGGRSCSVEVDLACGKVRLAGKPTELDASPIHEGLQEFIAFAVSRTASLTETTDSE
ncbi:hypothetical protein [Blastopirellula retiformator]|uniref:Uncharacterized protein n=1 Tax=Blastopirellula retiformator TaxID=2527970 RepID=A0A5C5VM69_9BACT|nr:hypothetical protein [Blastopirellula retiformator]TWT38852.1 hypothetical protein Enr8_05460 [Blastopirellula retiformator]